MRITDREEFWDDLIFDIEDRNVVPIIGQEAMRVTVSGSTVPLYTYLAEKLIEDLGIPAGGNRGANILSRVLCESPMFRERPQRIYRRLRSILEKEAIPVPEILRKLSAISGFHLFLTTTFDAFLERAIDQVRFGEAPITRAFMNSPRGAEDLPHDFSPDAPIVYHLFGKIDRKLEFAATEGDVLEFIHAMQAMEVRPQRLFDELHKKDLLFLGNNFPDWLARFFLRIIKGQALLSLHRKEEIIVDRVVTKDPDQLYFLEKFSPRTEIIDLSLPAFIDTLYEKWIELHPEDRLGEKTGEKPSSPAAGAETVPQDLPEMKSGAVFLSYASEDADAALRVKACLDSAGLDVWMDKRRLDPGDAYQRKIKRNIRKCALFIPLLSKNVEGHTKPRFYRKEWAWALDKHLELTGTDTPFILPVVVDDLDFYGSMRIPDEFREIHCEFAKKGSLPARFLKRNVRIIREFRKQER